MLAGAAAGCVAGTASAEYLTSSERRIAPDFDPDIITVGAGVGIDGVGDSRSSGTILPDFVLDMMLPPPRYMTYPPTSTTELNVAANLNRVDFIAPPQRDS